MRAATATTDSRQISAIRGRACCLVARHPVYGWLPCLLDPGSYFVGSRGLDQPFCLESSPSPHYSLALLLQSLIRFYDEPTASGLAPRTVTVLLGTGALHFGACPNLKSGTDTAQTAEPVPWAPRAGLATRLSDFATNRHESCGLVAPRDGFLDGDS
jgi:hypothetical protein